MTTVEMECTRGLWLGPEQTQPSNALVLQIELKLSRDANPDGLIHPRPGAARGSMNSRAGKECRRGLHLPPRSTLVALSAIGGR